MKAVVAAFNQEKAPDYEPSDLLRMELFEALLNTAVRVNGVASSVIKFVSCLRT